jgi:hypothetical protein
MANEKKAYVVRGDGTVYFTCAINKQIAVDNWKMWYLGTIAGCPEPESIVPLE